MTDSIRKALLESITTTQFASNFQLFNNMQPNTPAQADKFREGGKEKKLWKFSKGRQITNLCPISEWWQQKFFESFG